MNPEPQPSPQMRGSTAVLRVVLVYAGFAALWILLSDRLVVLVARSPGQIALLSTVKGWLFVGVTSLLLYRMMHHQLVKDRPIDERRGRGRLAVSPLVILGAFILGLTWVAIRQVYRQQERTEGARLQAIADLKARQVTDWVRERLGDAQYAQSSQVWSDLYFAWKASGDPGIARDVAARLDILRQGKGFRDALVLDGQAPDLFAPGSVRQQVAPVLRTAAAAAGLDRQVRLVGPYRDAGGALHLDFLCPLSTPGTGPAPVVVLGSDPAIHLFPLLHAWPVPSATGEAVLFRRDGDRVQFLSTGGGPGRPAVTAEQPLADSSLLSARFLRGQEPAGALIKGSDYRGRETCGVVQPIAGTDWFLAAKIDRDELDAGARPQAATLALAGLLCVFLASVASHLFRQQRLLAEAERERGVQAERLRALRAVSESEQRFRQLFDAAPVPMCLVGEGERLIANNGQFTRSFGYTLAEIPDLGQWLARAYPDAREREVAGHLWGRPAGTDGAPPFETVVTCKDGERRTVLGSMTAFGGESLVILADITERVRAEAERQRLQGEIQQAQKMDSIGRLAGGVAHDFNNMLGVIVANAEIGILAGGAGLARFEEIKSAALRSADLTRQLLAFARKQTVSPQVVSLNEGIPGVLQMLARLIGENITLDYAQRAGLWNIRMDPGQLDQILANLAVNARDAIAGIGCLRIHTGNVEVQAADLPSGSQSPPGDYVLLEVADNGCGMDEEQQKHIFEPFYTTKGLGKGTGLGLATVYGIVKQNAGFIRVDSAPGRGTTFRVYLPRFRGAAESPAQPQAAAAHGGGEAVLVVEDEAMNLAVTGMLLQSLGYAVIAAASPGEALRALEDPARDIRLLFTDIIMPEMNGRELAVRARSLRPGLKCLYMSGYTADVIAQHGVLDPEIRLLGKPFTIDALSAAVREALEG